MSLWVMKLAIALTLRVAWCTAYPRSTIGGDCAVDIPTHNAPVTKLFRRPGSILKALKQEETLTTK